MKTQQSTHDGELVTLSPTLWRSTSPPFRIHVCHCFSSILPLLLSCWGCHAAAVTYAITIDCAYSCSIPWRIPELSDWHKCISS